MPFQHIKPAVRKTVLQYARGHVGLAYVTDRTGERQGADARMDAIQRVALDLKETLRKEHHLEVPALWCRMLIRRAWYIVPREMRK